MPSLCQAGTGRRCASAFKKSGAATTAMTSSVGLEHGLIGSRSIRGRRGRREKPSEWRKQLVTFAQMEGSATCDFGDFGQIAQLHRDGPFSS